MASASLKLKPTARNRPELITFPKFLRYEDRRAEQHEGSQDSKTSKRKGDVEEDLMELIRTDDDILVSVPVSIADDKDKDGGE